MTSTWFVFLIACIALVSSLLSFTKEISKLHPNLKFVNEIGLKILAVVVLFILTIIFTNAYNDYTTGQSEIKSATQHKADSVTLAKHDSLANVRVDSLNLNTVKLLAGYGYKVDSTNNEIIKALDTAVGKNVPHLTLRFDETGNAKYIFEEHSWAFPYGIINDGTGVSFNGNNEMRAILKTTNGFFLGESYFPLINSLSTLGVNAYFNKTVTIIFPPQSIQDTVFLWSKITYTSQNGHPFSTTFFLRFIGGQKQVLFYNPKINPPLYHFLKSNNLQIE